MGVRAHLPQRDSEHFEHRLTDIGAPIGEIALEWPDLTIYMSRGTAERLSVDLMLALSELADRDETDN